jgi:hypothetical protein
MYILQDNENPADIYFSIHIRKKSQYVMEFLLLSDCLIFYGRFGGAGRRKTVVRSISEEDFGLRTSD